ncbi:hypothetical protein IEQ34_012641 [Dendrobium chrysotoxum]|uniref:Uncharacterized protein n=1 Tax=Dendrobium chrysotoxum TaxID=161865 RepID=A0AAV7GMF5_DENCH|nr:hypothetical protein IEQ34_012641 [Dendrobium chrysotoxum]
MKGGNLFCFGVFGGPLTSNSVTIPFGRRYESSTLPDWLRQNPRQVNSDHTSISNALTSAAGERSGHRFPTNITRLSPANSSKSPSIAVVDHQICEDPPIPDPIRAARFFARRRRIRLRSAQRQRPFGSLRASRMRMLKMLQGQQQQIATHSAVVLPAISGKRGLCFEFSFTIAGGDRFWVICWHIGLW